METNNKEVVLKLNSFNGSEFVRGKISDFIECIAFKLRHHGISFNAKHPKTGVGLATFANKAKKAEKDHGFTNGFEWFSYVSSEEAKHLDDRGVKFHDPSYYW